MLSPVRALIRVPSLGLIANVRGAGYKAGISSVASCILPLHEERSSMMEKYVLTFLIKDDSSLQMVSDVN
jgi:hypothetical protein